jgi:membrane protein YqaA with SNARE-associated domain
MTSETLQEPAIGGDIQLPDPDPIPQREGPAEGFLNTRMAIDTVLNGTKNGVRKVSGSVKDHAIFLSILGFIILWSLLMVMVGPDAIVDRVGVNNGYILVFLAASVGGASTVSSASFYATIFTLASGGLNPLALGIIAGIGVTIGDSLFFYFGKKGRDIAPERFQDRIDQLTDWLKERKDAQIQAFALTYAGFVPLPNEILTISVSLSGYPYRKIIGPILLGNIILMSIIAYLATMDITLPFI